VSAGIPRYSVCVRAVQTQVRVSCKKVVKREGKRCKWLDDRKLDGCRAGQSRLPGPVTE
jgi:hypothetical protein